MKRDEALDISLIELLARFMLASSRKVPLMHERLIEVLSEGTARGKTNRELLAEGCFNNMFFLGAQAGTPEG